MEEISVEQGAYRIVKRPVLLTTDGLGPCVGVAVAWHSIAAVLHSPNPRMEEESVTTPFFRKLVSLIPSEIRKLVEPIVCGAGMQSYFDDNQDNEINEEVEQMRGYIVEKCVEYGFARPIEQWCAPGSNQSIVIDMYSKSIRIETEGKPDRTFSISNERA